MFCYKENRFVSQTHGKREDAGAQWIDTHPAGISAQLEFSCTLIRCGFSVCRREERISLFAMAAEQLSVSERLAMLLHDLRGDDSRYLDETSDPASQAAWIVSGGQGEDRERPAFQDYCGLLVESEKAAKEFLRLFEEARRHVRERENVILLEELMKRQKNIVREIGRLKEGTARGEVLTFGLTGDGAWDTDSSNYFDEQTPRFFSEREIRNS